MEISNPDNFIAQHAVELVYIVQLSSYWENINESVNFQIYEMAPLINC